MYSFQQIVHCILLFAGCCRMLPSASAQSLIKLRQSTSALRTCPITLHCCAMWVWLSMLCDAADYIQCFDPRLLNYY